MNHAERDGQPPAEPAPAAAVDRGNDRRLVERGHCGAACFLGPTLPIDAHHAIQRPRRAPSRVRLRAVSVEPITGLRPELLEALALRRAQPGGVARSGDHYYDHGRPMPSYLTGTLNNLADAGLLVVAEESWGMRRVSLTEAGHTRYTQLSATLLTAKPSSADTTPQDRRLATGRGTRPPTPAPGGQPATTTLPSEAKTTDARHTEPSVTLLAQPASRHDDANPWEAVPMLQRSEGIPDGG